MPFPMKIQPIDIDSQAAGESVRADSAKPVLKSRLRRLFDRPFPSVLRIASSEKPSVGETTNYSSKDEGTEFEPTSVCLDKMVRSFIEESNEKHPQQAVAGKCGRNRCNCFNATSNDSSDDEFDVLGSFGESTASGSSNGDTCDFLKSLIPCASVIERNLLADAAKIVEKKSKIIGQKDELRQIVVEGLSSLGYDSSVCKSKWEKNPSFPAGAYEYIDVILEGDRLLVDIDFRSEFEIARPTGTYKVILQSLPSIFVGRSDRLGQIVSIVSEAAKFSLKKKGMHLPPWRKSEYMRAKWLSPPIRTSKPISSEKAEENDSEIQGQIEVPSLDEKLSGENDCGDLELIFGGQTPASDNTLDSDGSQPPKNIEKNEKTPEFFPAWEPPAIRPRSVERGAKVVTGLASLLGEKP